MAWRLITTIWLCFYYPFVLSAAAPVEVLRIAAGSDGFVRVVMRVEPHAGTRVVCLVWYPEAMEEFSSKSCGNEEGLKAPVIYTYERTLPHGGIWYFKGVVERNDRTVVSAPKAVIVGGP